MNDDDEIGSALFGRTPPDLSPLVRLLKSDRPISAGVRDILAQMIDPDSSGYLYFKLVLENKEGKIRNQTRDLITLELAQYHAALVASGKSANQAAIETGAKFNMDQRRVYERLREMKVLRSWIKGET